MKESEVKALEQAMSSGWPFGATHLTADDEQLDGRVVTVDGQRLVNFSSCSYLGLEQDHRLKAAAIEAIEKYGTQFSSSRAYISAPPYRELESLLDRIFDGHVVVTPSTTLGHLAALPMLINENDAVVLDHYVHNSVQMATKQLRVSGTHVEIVRHGRLDLLDERITELSRKHRHVWYLADGVYSMYADLAPVEELDELLSRHDQLHLYIDDAHGIGWAGTHGRGTVLDRLAGRSRVVVAASLNKAFGAGGGAIVFPDVALKKRMMCSGPPMLFSGPVQPPLLGAAIAAAKILLSPEIVELQAQLRERVERCNRVADELGLPLVTRSVAPIRCVGLGIPLAAMSMVERLRKRGSLTNAAAFPAVPLRHSGVRFCINVNHSMADIDQLLTSMAAEIEQVLAETGTSVQEIRKQFAEVVPDLPSPRCPSRPKSARRSQLVRSKLPLTLRRDVRISDVPRAQWNRLLGHRGTFSWEGLQLLERTFGRPSSRPENNWQFRYYRVLDSAGRVVLATFCTVSLRKDDMLAPASVSQQVESKRKSDPYYLTSRTFMMGSMLTEGNHLYLDRTLDWEGALELLLRQIQRDAQECGAPSIVIRDLPAVDRDAAALIARTGFLEVDAPNSMEAKVSWDSHEEFMSCLSHKFRKFQRREVIPWTAAYELEVIGRGGRSLSDSEFQHVYRLYQNVQRRSLRLNTFALPPILFRNMLEAAEWEACLLTLRPDVSGAPRGGPHAAVFSYVGANHYAPMVVGLDYDYVESHGLYRQCLASIIERARFHGSQRILFGMDAELEKRRFAARPRKQVLFVQNLDHFNQDVLSGLSAASVA